MAPLNYYQDPMFMKYVSNSQLGDFYKVLYAQQERVLDLQKIFDFGNLVDAGVTERHKLDFATRTLTEESSGRLIQFTREDWTRGIAMADAVDADPVIQMLKPTCLPQYIILKSNFVYNYQGQSAVMPTRCKFDFLNKLYKTAIDIKTTGCTTQESFVKSMTTFKYFRQAALYMDLAKVDKMWYVAVSKTKDRYGKYPIFRFAIQRDDINYLQGRNEYSKLGFLYRHMIYDFKLPTTLKLAS